jgi:MoaA/NifB/PqqE/SkfB family radical SAM enzyme
VDYKRILERLPYIPKKFYISGGEPTLWPGLVELCKKLVDINVFVSIQTNCTYPNIIKSLIDVGVTHFNLSIDGIEAIHDSIRGKGTYTKFLQTVSAISSSRNCQFVTTTVISDLNFHSVDKLFSSFKKRGVRPTMMIFELARRYDKETISVSAATAGVDVADIPVTYESTRKFQIELSDLKKVIAKIETLSKSYSRKMMFFPYDLGCKTELFYNYSLRQSNQVRCSHRSALRIDPVGNIIPCFTFRNSLGNLFNDPFDMIVENTNSFWNRMEKKNLAPVCDTCFRCVEHHS